MNGQNQLTRLLVASAIVAVALIGLWQAGILFQPEDATITSDGQTVNVSPADVSVETPTDGSRKIGLEAGDLAPDFEFSNFDGERVRLSDYRGRPVFLNFWASWCLPCRAEMPNMMTMLDLYGSGDDGLAIIGVNNGEAVERAQQFLDDLDIQLTTYAYDPSQEIVKRYNVTLGMPTSYFIDADGVITRMIIGQISYNVMDTSVQEVIAGYDSIQDD